jgi:hypothetical protein
MANTAELIDYTNRLVEINNFIIIDIIKETKNQRGKQYLT